MQALQDLRRPRVLHPFLLAACPAIALFGQNAAALTWGRIVPSIGFCVLAAFVVWLVIARACRDIHRAGVATSVLIVAWFLAWPVLENVIAWVIPIGWGWPAAVNYLLAAIVVLVVCVVPMRRARTKRARVALVIGGLAMVVVAASLSPAFGRRAALIISVYLATSLYVCVLVLQYRGDLHRLTSTGNVFGVALFALYAGFALIQDRAHSAYRDVTPGWTEAPAVLTDPLPVADLPNVIVLALDGYPRADALMETLAHDNSAFENALTARGFHVARGIESREAEPVQALAACLNLTPIDAIAPDGTDDVLRAQIIQQLLRDNRLFPRLVEMGYDVVTVDPGIEALRLSSPPITTLRPTGVLGEFERILCEGTILARVQQLYYFLRYRNPAYWRFEPTRSHVEFAFDVLPEAASDEGPTFAFAYVPVPEPPFLFRADGSRAYPFAIGPLDTARLFFDPAVHRAAFLAQLAYVNERVLETVDRIQADEARDNMIAVVSVRGGALRGVAERPPRAAVFAAVYPEALAPPEPGVLVDWFSAIMARSTTTAYP
jgi:hypothetical protein